MAENFYETLAADYDRMIPWDKRLRNERPLFEALWRKYQVRSVLDASCGTGRHLALFAEMGLEVAGADASAEMTALARSYAAETGSGLGERIYECPWSRLPEEVPGRFNAVLCIGNSLPYVTDPDELRRSLAGLWSKVSLGGVLVIQFKNFARLIATRQRFLPVTSTPPPREMVAVREYEYAPGRVNFHVLLLEKNSEGAWALRHQETPLRPWRPAEIEHPLNVLGCGQVEIYGSLGLTPFDVAVSEDVVVVARN